ncbi:MAG: CPBP family intramembrane metalloprotease [Clostridia bacterium]|nr:CPBP family intramembrane metalloprotease [Clostridia bacterium]
MEPMETAPSTEEMEQNITESHLLKSDAQWIGLGFLLLLGLSLIGEMLFPAILDLFWPHNASRGVYYQAIVYVFSSPFCILPAFYITAKGSNRSLTDVLPFQRVNGWELTGGVLFGFLGILFGNALSIAVQPLFPYAQDNLDALMGEMAKTPYELIVELLYICVVPAIVEELAFRGVVLQILRKYGDGFAIVVSALLFGLFHGNVVQLPFAIGLGIVAGYITVRTNSMLPAMILHFCNNAMSCFVSYFGDWIYGHLGSFTVYTLYLLWLVMGAVGVLILYFHRAKQPNPWGWYDGCLSLGKRTLLLFKAPVFDVAVILLLAMALFLTLPMVV